MDGFILDASSTGDRVVVWVRDASPAGTAVPVVEPFTPEFFVRAAPDRLAEVRDAVSLFPGVAAGAVGFERRLCALEDEPSLVLRVPVRRHDRLHAVARVVDEWGTPRVASVAVRGVRTGQRNSATCPAVGRQRDQDRRGIV